MGFTIENEVRKVVLAAVPITSATALPMVRKEGTNNVILYGKNLATCIVYAVMKGCNIITSSTASWFTAGTTATFAASATTCYQSYSMSAWQAPYNYITFEYVGAATGGVSAIQFELTVW